MQPPDTSKVHNCIPDEHYVPTLLAVRILFFFPPDAVITEFIMLKK